MSKRRKPEFSRSDDLDTQSAATKVQELLKLSLSERTVLLAELLKSKEDPILALKVNPGWVAHNAPGAETAVLNEIAGFEMEDGERRDQQSPGFLYHFKTSFELGECKKSVLANHANAFALGPQSIALLGPAAAGLAFNREPLAFTAVIHIVAIRQDDVESYEFFITS